MHWYLAAYYISLERKHFIDEGLPSFIPVKGLGGHIWEEVCDTQMACGGD
jgi:hypothetical protein